MNATLILTLAATTLAQTLVALAMLAPAAIAPEIGQSLDMSPALIGVWVSLAYGGAMVSSLAGAGLVRRFGPARTTQAALALAAAGMAASAVPDLLALLAGAALVGLGYGMTNPAASHLLTRATPEHRRNLVFSIKQAGVPLGGTLAGLLAPPIALAWGWPAALALIGLLSAVLALALERTRQDWDADRRPEAPLAVNPIEGLGMILADRRLRALSLAGFLYAAVQLSLSSFLVAMLVGELDWSLVDAGLLLAAAQISGVLGRLALGLLADRLHGGTAILVGIGLATGLTAFVVGLLNPGWPVTAVSALMLVMAACALGWNGIYLAEIARAAPTGRVPRATGASLFFTYGGVLVGPSAFALVHEGLGGYAATYAVFALPALAGAWLLFRTEESFHE